MTDTEQTVDEQIPEDDQTDEEVVEIEEELDELVEVDVTAERDQYLALAQRTQADFENYRKRVARESAAAQERGVAKLAKELLPARDNLDRALDAAATDDPLAEEPLLTEPVHAASRAAADRTAIGTTARRHLRRRLNSFTGESP